MTCPDCDGTKNVALVSEQMVALDVTPDTYLACGTCGATGEVPDE